MPEIRRVVYKFIINCDKESDILHTQLEQCTVSVCVCAYIVCYTCMYVIVLLFYIVCMLILFFIFQAAAS